MQTIGERLEDARKRKGTSIREAADATKIRGDYLQKFENNQFDIGLTEIYVRGFLRNYAVFLRLPSERVLNDFSALGHGESRPRQPSREIYGRMDVSVASADEPGERPAAVDTAAKAEPSRPPQRVPRSPGGSLPAMPSINPALVFKGGIALACIIVVLLLIWIVKSLMGSGDSTAATEHSTAPAITQAPAGPTFGLLALDTVQVEVSSVADGRILYQGTLAAGQTQTVPWPGELYIRANPGENLKVVVRGKPYPLPPAANGSTKGDNRVKLPGPT